MPDIYEALLAQADEAASKAYVPYSGFHVGAALLTTDGAVVQGCNVENVSYGLTNCAERTAVFSAVTGGHQEFSAIAIVQGNAPAGAAEPCWPCGACRQVLAEFNPEMDVVFREGTGYRVTKLSELLPYSFDKARLNVR
ncbi:MAG: cytidine deaminase [Candidatus Sericytochromatia bacterium]